MFTLPIDAPPALPLWIDGHAVLTLTDRFLDVCAARNSAVLRRAPVCGDHEIGRAWAAAQSASLAWGAATTVERQARLAALAEALAGYAAHFSALLAEEAGMDTVTAAAEVEAALVALRAPVPGIKGGDVVAVVARPESPLAESVRVASTALLDGAALVVCSASGAPSAVLALAELSARCAFPPGVFNVLHGDAETAALLVRMQDQPHPPGEVI